VELGGSDPFRVDSAEFWANLAQRASNARLVALCGRRGRTACAPASRRCYARGTQASAPASCHRPTLRRGGHRGRCPHVLSRVVEHDGLPPSVEPCRGARQRQKDLPHGSAVGRPGHLRPMRRCPGSGHAARRRRSLRIGVGGLRVGVGGLGAGRDGYLPPQAHARAAGSPRAPADHLEERELLARYGLDGLGPTSRAGADAGSSARRSCAAESRPEGTSITDAVPPPAVGPGVRARWHPPQLRPRRPRRPHAAGEYT
jgi:hypothetical protein